MGGGGVVGTSTICVRATGPLHIVINASREEYTRNNRLIIRQGVIKCDEGPAGMPLQGMNDVQPSS